MPSSTGSRQATSRAGASRGAGDVNGDGTVDFTDLWQVIDNMGSACDTPEACPEDVDGNGVVNIFDVPAVFTHLGPCP